MSTGSEDVRSFTVSKVEAGGKGCADCTDSEACDISTGEEGETCTDGKVGTRVGWDSVARSGLG